MTVNTFRRGSAENEIVRATRSFMHKPPTTHRRSIVPRSSVYYWWFEFLKRNEDYKRCCERGGKGKMATLYKDFGNVFDYEFVDWWNEDRRGERLFAEPLAPIRLEELQSSAQWDVDWTHEGVMVIAVPLDHPKRRINRWFQRLLNERHRGQPGKPIKESAALYKVSKRFTVQSLEQSLLVWDFAQANKEMTLAQMGRELGLVTSARPSVGESIALAAKKRNRISATVSRYLRRAELMIQHVGEGRFPCTDE